MGSRDNWFPPIENFGFPERVGRGKFFVVEGLTGVRRDLVIEEDSFDDQGGGFVSHGLDIWWDDSEPDRVLLFAVNHAVDRDRGIKGLEGVRSRVEIFEHQVGSGKVRWRRSVQHEAIRTPNDLLVVGEREFYVTNDHRYREGLWRLAEDIGFEWARWSDVVRVKLGGLEKGGKVEVEDAMGPEHNPNGLGHGKGKGDVLLGRAIAGVVAVMKRRANGTLEIVEEVQMPNTIDNPVYFHDPYVKETGKDASGFVIAGMPLAKGFPAEEFLHSAVWLVSDGAGMAGKGTEREKRLIFQDDGHIMHSASTAIIVAINPKDNAGKKEGWLYVTGPLGKGVVRTKIEL